MDEDEAIYLLYDAFNRLTTERIRVSAMALGVLKGGALVPESYRGGDTVLVSRDGLFKHLKNYCAGAFEEC